MVFNNEITNQLLAIKPGVTEDNVRNKEMRLEFKDKRHDYHVIAALFHIAEYHSDWVSWQQVN